MRRTPEDEIAAIAMAPAGFDLVTFDNKAKTAKAGRAAIWRVACIIRPSVRLPVMKS